MWQLQPSTQKVTPSFPTPSSKSWGPVKPPLLENLVGGSTPPAERGGGGAHYAINFADVSNFLAKIVPLLKAIVWELC